MARHRSSRAPPRTIQAWMADRQTAQAELAAADPGLWDWVSFLFWWFVKFTDVDQDLGGILHYYQAVSYAVQFAGFCLLAIAIGGATLVFVPPRLLFAHSQDLGWSVIAILGCRVAAPMVRYCQVERQWTGLLLTIVYDCCFFSAIDLASTTFIHISNMNKTNELAKATTWQLWKGLEGISATNLVIALFGIGWGAASLCNKHNPTAPTWQRRVWAIVASIICLVAIVLFAAVPKLRWFAASLYIFGGSFANSLSCLVQLLDMTYHPLRTTATAVELENQGLQAQVRGLTQNLADKTEEVRRLKDEVAQLQTQKTALQNQLHGDM